MTGRPNPASARDGDSTSRGEWITAAVSAIFILAVIGYLLYDGFSRPVTPPDLVVRVDSVTSATSGFHVHVSARNVGRATAAGAVIRGELREGTEVIEQSEITIAFLPGEGERGAGLHFSRDPRLHTLSVRALGYDLP